MTLLVAAALFFAALHLLVAGTRLRDVLVEKMGEQPYLGLFSLASLAGIMLVVRGYRTAFAGDNPILWVPPIGLLHAAGPVMLVALFFAVVGLTSPNPTSYGQEGRVEKDPTPVGIQRVTRHPFLTGVALWAAFHLASNGDLASIILFSTFLVVSVLGMPSIDAKRRRKLGSAWDAYASVTSAVPFLAIAQGRTTLSFRELGWWRPIVTIVVFGATVAIHPWAFGAFPLPGMSD